MAADVPNTTFMTPHYRRRKGASEMELIVINERKLKVMLSDEEMTQYDLDTIDACPGADIHTSLRGMMCEIRKKTGFNADCERVYIQLYPCRSGGCELYLTMLDSQADEPVSDIQYQCASELATTDFARMRGTVYCFDSLSELIAACRAIAHSPHGISDSSAFASDDGSAFLIFGNGLTVAEEELISEFGRSEFSSTVSAYMSEHWRNICIHNAVPELARY